jgi:hypothetical protein
MSRPYYATPKDLERQERIVHQLRKRMPLKLVKRLNEQPVTHQMILNDGTRVGAKVEWRKPSLQLMERWGGYGIGEDRWLRMKGFVDERAWALWFVIAAADHLWLCRDALDHDGTYWGGRWDRNDPKDQETMVSFRFRRWTDMGDLRGNSLW